MVEVDKVIALLEEAKAAIPNLRTSYYTGKSDAIEGLINKIKSL